MTVHHVISFDETAEDLDAAYHSIAATRSAYRKAHPPAPVPTQTPTPTPVPVPAPVPIPASNVPLLQSGNWNTELATRRGIVCSPETVAGSGESTYANIVAGVDRVTFTVLDPATAPDHQAGARLSVDPRQLKTWDGLSYLICQALQKPFAVGELKGHTLEFLDTWEFPGEIPLYYGDGAGWMSAGWQFKANSSAGAMASMAMNLHTFRGEGMRYWLQANDYAHRGQDDTFPLIPVGADVDTRLVVHFDSDPARGWMRLEYLSKTLSVFGANCAEDGSCGCYQCLYGTAPGVLLCKSSTITLID